MDNITLHHCPTEAMHADLLTKLLQGALFLKFRDTILGYTHMSTLHQLTMFSSKEGVEVLALADILVDGHIPSSIAFPVISLFFTPNNS